MKLTRAGFYLPLICTLLAGLVAWALWKQPFLELAGFGSSTIDGYSWEELPADADRSQVMQVFYALLGTAILVWLPGRLKILAILGAAYSAWTYYQCLKPQLENLAKMRQLGIEGGAEAQAMVQTAVEGINPLSGAWISGSALVLLLIFTLCLSILCIAKRKPSNLAFSRS